MTLPAARGSTKNAEAPTIAHAIANTRNIPRQPISSFSHPPTIRPARIPAEIPAVTIPSTVARRWGFAKRPATELNCAPTDDPAPTTPITRPRSHGAPTRALTANAVASALNCVETTCLGANRSTSGTSRASPTRYPSGPHARARPIVASDACREPATSAIAG